MVISQRYRAHALRGSRRTRSNSGYGLYCWLITAMVTLLQLNSVEALRVDRFQHFSISLLAFIILYALTSKQGNGWIPALIGAFLLGLCKELFDPVFCPLDMCANLTGIGVGMLIVFAGQIFVGRSGVRI